MSTALKGQHQGAHATQRQGEAPTPSLYDQRGWPIEKILPLLDFPLLSDIALPDYRPYRELADDEAEARAMAFERHLHSAEKVSAAAQALADHVIRCFDYEELTREKRWRWQKNAPANTFHALLAAYNGAVLDLPSQELRKPCERFSQVAQSAYYFACAWHAAHDTETGLGNAAQDDDRRWIRLRTALAQACAGSDQKYTALDIVRLQESARKEDRVRDIRRDVVEAARRCFDSRATTLTSRLSATINSYKAEIKDDRSALAQAMREDSGVSAKKSAPAWKVRWYQFREGLLYAGGKKHFDMGRNGKVIATATSVTTGFILACSAAVAGPVMFATLPLSAGLAFATSRFLMWQDKKEERHNKMHGLPNNKIKADVAKDCYYEDVPLSILGCVSGIVLPAVASLTLIGSMWGEVRRPHENTAAEAEAAATRVPAPASANSDPSTLSTPKGELKIEFDQKGSAAKPTVQPQPAAAPAAPKPQQ